MDPLKPLRALSRRIHSREAQLEALRRERNQMMADIFVTGEHSERAVAEAAGVTKGWAWRVKSGKAPMP